MRISKYEGANMREALAAVKKELGPEAMVISTRQIRRGLLGTGVEVTAAVDAPERKRVPRTPARPAGLAEEDIERIMAPLRSELRSLRSMIRSSGEGRANEEVRRELVAMRAALAALQTQAERTTPPLEKVASANRITAGSRGRVIALVGPTGVGKTTTIAKLAARAHLVDHLSVAVVTLDNYRVGGEAQMRMFAELIGIPMFTLGANESLADRLRVVADYDIVYVDTAGCSPRDNEAIENLRLALRGVGDLEIHLAIAAGCSPATIDAICDRYSALTINRLLMTKLDEADDLGELVRAPARHRMPISFITTGQAVPEDLEDATDDRLLELAQQGLTICAAAA